MRFAHIILRGIGQVMFQNNIYSGLLFLIGIFFNSWLLGLAAICGTIISTVTAEILKYDRAEIQNGIYGFNGALTGIAILCFFDLNMISISVLISASALSTLIMNFLKKLLSPFTAPFVLVTWAAIYLLLLLFKHPLLPLRIVDESALQLISASGNSFGQVMFQENVVTGLLFLLAIVVNNKLMAIYTVYAAVLGSLTGWLISDSSVVVNAGLMGYNAILCAIALTGKRWLDFFWITIAIILSTIINIGIARTGIITLTAPFVLTIWIILLLKQKVIVLQQRRV